MLLAMCSDATATTGPRAGTILPGHHSKDPDKMPVNLVADEKHSVF